MAYRKEVCKWGHPLEGDNLILYTPQGLISKFERRICRACRQRRTKEQHEREKTGEPKRSRGAPKTAFCPKGHPKTMENLIISYAKRIRGRGEEYWYPVRICRQCQKANTQRIRAAKKEAKNNGTS